MKRPTPEQIKDEAVAKIALSVLDVDVNILEDRSYNSRDLQHLAARSIKAALEAAYEAGRRAPAERRGYVVVRRQES